MYIHEDTEYLYVATYGRSIYKLDIANDVLGIESNLFASEVKIYPNPASEYVNISFVNLSERISVVVYNQLGSVVINKEYTSITSEEKISLEGITAGIYYVQITSETAKTTKKLLVK